MLAALAVTSGCDRIRLGRSHGRGCCLGGCRELRAKCTRLHIKRNRHLLADFVSSSARQLLAEVAIDPVSDDAIGHRDAQLLGVAVVVHAGRAIEPHVEALLPNFTGKPLGNARSDRVGGCVIHFTIPFK